MSVLLAPILAQALSLTVGAREEARIRTELQQYLDFVTTGRVGFHMRSERTRWDLTYSPMFTQMALGAQQSSTLVYHSGVLTCSHALSPNTTILATQVGTYGEQNFRLAGLSASTMPSASPTATSPTAAEISPGGGTSPNSVSQPNPANYKILQGATVSTLALRHRLDRNWGAVMTGTYSLSQGLDTPSRRALPRAESVASEMRLSLAASPLDVMSFGVANEYLTTKRETVLTSAPSTGAGFGIAPSGGFQTTLRRVEMSRSEVGWQHRWSPKVTSTISGGVSAAYLWGIDVQAKFYLMPVATAAAEYAETAAGGRLTLGLAQQLLPVTDRLTGIPTLRASTNGNARWQRRPFTVGVTSSWLKSVDSSAQTQFLRSGFTGNQYLAYALSREWNLETGLRETWQKFSGTTGTFLWSVYFAVAFESQNIPF